MSTALVINGRLAYGTPDVRAARRKLPRSLVLPRAKDGTPVDTSPMPSGRPKPFLEGETAYDYEEAVAYRVLKTLNPAQGWASSAFWQERWDLPHQDIIALVRAGELDAAAQEGSLYRRYRCRDESAVKRSDAWRIAKARISTAKSQITRKLRGRVGNNKGPKAL